MPKKETGKVLKARVDAVLEAEEGEDGVKVMALNPGLIILGLLRPGMDGFEVHRWIKEDQSTFHINIIVITGYDSPENRNRIIVIEAGYIPKPFDGEILF
ncbi:MAG: response regulator [Deltaproteobacteria bacterium]|nr:response regulator [Deltaproteobacteria bacterium]